jgi:hypothetical protein
LKEQVMAENMVRTQVYLPRDVYMLLKKRAVEEGLPIGQQIREALDEYLISQEADELDPILTADDPFWQLVGMAESDITDGSVDHDKYIYARDWD